MRPINLAAGGLDSLALPATITLTRLEPGQVRVAAPGALVTIEHAGGNESRRSNVTASAAAGPVTITVDDAPGLGAVMVELPDRPPRGGA